MSEFGQEIEACTIALPLLILLDICLFFAYDKQREFVMRCLFGWKGTGLRVKSSSELPTDVRSHVFTQELTSNPSQFPANPGNIPTRIPGSFGNNSRAIPEGIPGHSGILALKSFRFGNDPQKSVCVSFA